MQWLGAEGRVCSEAVPTKGRVIHDFSHFFLGQKLWAQSETQSQLHFALFCVGKWYDSDQMSQIPNQETSITGFAETHFAAVQMHLKPGTANEAQVYQSHFSSREGKTYTWAPGPEIEGSF